ncbi:MAG: exopolysaccharide biosynthesis protein [Verrucomicrobia bacterium]|nr:exopolysaccharide biosynthesis protein [Verrucomicrobiota bacterium]
MHERLSEKLAQMLEQNSSSHGVSLNHLLEKTDGRGFYLVVILLALPFIIPMAIPGVSTVLGLSVSLLSFKLAFGVQPRLPKLMGDRTLSPDYQRKVIKGSVKIVRIVEKFARPRRTPWMTTRIARSFNALLMTLMGLLLALPFPPFPPLTNALPCYCIILLAASMMEEDGVMIWFAYLLSLGTVIYLALNIFVIFEAVKKSIELLRGWLT